jgi:hypothetical protein
VRKEEGKSKKREKDFSKNWGEGHEPPQEATDDTREAEDPLELWNSLVQRKLDLPPLAQGRFVEEICLLQAEPFFEGVSWETFCRKVASTPFLMGANSSGFKATLTWAVRPQNARKILEDHFYSPEITPSEASSDFQEAPWPDFVSNLRAHVTRLNTSNRWFEASKVIAITLWQAK